MYQHEYFLKKMLKRGGSLLSQYGGVIVVVGQLIFIVVLVVQLEDSLSRSERDIAALEADIVKLSQLVVCDSFARNEVQSIGDEAKSNVDAGSSLLAFVVNNQTQIVRDLTSQNIGDLLTNITTANDELSRIVNPDTNVFDMSIFDAPTSTFDYSYNTSQAFGAGHFAIDSQYIDFSSLDTTRKCVRTRLRDGIALCAATDRSNVFRNEFIAAVTIGGAKADITSGITSGVSGNLGATIEFDFHSTIGGNDMTMDCCFTQGSGVDVRLRQYSLAFNYRDASVDV